MDRYHLLINKKTFKPEAYQFKASNSIYHVSQYLWKCIKNRGSFDSSNINSTILDGALIKVSKETGYPIVVASETMEKVLRMTYGYKKIYSSKTIPYSVYQVICYYRVNKDELSDKEIVLIVSPGQV
jgi:hypothetical protein